MIGNSVTVGTEKAGAPTLLWTNPDPTISFSGEEITFGGTYSGYIVELRRNTAAVDSAKIYVPVGTENKYLYAVNTITYNAGSRLVSMATNNSIHFGQAIRGNGSTASNDYAIPTKVYGVKWAL